MDTLDQALLVSFISAIGFTFGVPALLVVFKYPHKLGGQIYFDKQSRFIVLGKAALLMVGSGFVLGWLGLQVIDHFNEELQFSAGESYRRADTYAWIARHWTFAFFLVGVISFKITADAVNTLVGREEKKDGLKDAYNARNWATPKETADRLSRSGSNPIHGEGIHIGAGWHWNEKGHMLTVGGSGQGKGVSLILPALLSNNLVRGAGVSVVCLDPKGENAAVAAPHLQRCGYDVHILNPFGIAEIDHLGNSQWNPLDLIDPASNNASKLYDVLAAALHSENGKKGDSGFFNDRCRQYISLYISYAHHTGVTDWTTIYKWFIASGDRRKELLASMASDETFSGADMAAAVSDRLTGEAAKTEENIYGTVEKAINILKDKNLRASLSGSDFDMREIAKKPTAIFVCIPFEELGYYAAWVRMFFNFLLRTLTRHYDVNRKVLVLLDEFAQLSYMDEVVKSSTVLRGYNVTLWPIVQGLGQLKHIYGEQWETFINTATIKHWLSAGADNTTAEYIQKRMPQALHFIGNNADGSPKEREKPLLNTSEVMGMKDIVCEISGLDAPARFMKEPYWDLDFTKNNASPNPFY